jgi:predicted ATP-dependent endonuclease of OLD family
MRLITKLTIKDFRSISQSNLDAPSGYLPLVGANNSGKSNFLRALNLFFNNETEPGRILNLGEDFHNPARKRKREITITLNFELPANFNIQRRIRNAVDNLLGRQFSIKKTWSIPGDPTEREAKLQYFFRKGADGDFTQANQDNEHTIRQFLSLIRFRYLPNHIHPSEVLRREQSAIQTELLTKLRRSKNVKQDQVSTLFEELQSLSGEFVRPIAQELQSAAEDIEEVGLSTPANLGELLFSFAPRLKVRRGETFNALFHGSGIQSLLTLLILRYLDSRFSARFGWHQATIWGIEEPESFLHQDLEHRVAQVLSGTGMAEDSRFQIFCTTHSDVFLRHSLYGALCWLESGKTGSEIREARALTGEAARLGISRYVPPILYGAPQPLLVCEGPSDKILIEYAYARLDIACPWEIQDVETLTVDSKLQGIDGLITYLRVNQGILGSRSLKAPVFVLIDWNEGRRKVSDVQGVLRTHLTSNVMQWSEDDTNPQLDRTFTGIERYLSTEVILAANQENLLEVRRPATREFPLSTNRHTIKKVELAKFVVSREQTEDISFFKSQMERLNKALAASQYKALQIQTESLFPNQVH